MPRTSKYSISQSNELIWNVAVYIRLSVEDGDKIESNSVSNQRMLLNGFLNDNPELNLYDYYIDDGYTGTDFERPGFKRLLKDMNEKKFNAVVVKDLSRLGRNYIEVGNYIERIFPLFNIRFIAINDSIDSYKDPKSVNNITVPFKNLINDEYCRDISNKIRSVLDVKKKNGEYVCALAPYGYIKDPDDIHHLIINEESAKIVRLIFKMSLEGNGRQTIAQKLNDMGILNPNGYKKFVLKNNKIPEDDKERIKYCWDMRTIKSVLENMVYCGDTVQSKGKLISYKIHKHIKNPKSEWIIVRNTHEAIIDRETFEKVQQGIISRDTRANKDGKINALSGHLKCADCGRAMNKKQGSYYKGKPREYYHYMCSTYMRKSKNLCTKHTIRNDILEESVLKSIKLQIELIADYESLIKDLKNNSNIDFRRQILENNIENAKKDLEKQRQLKKMAYEDWKLNIITEQEYIEYSNSYTNVINRVENNISNLYKELDDYTEKKEDDNWVNKFIKYKDITELSRDVVDSLIDEIYVYEDKRIKIKFRYEDEFRKTIEYLQKVKKITNSEEKIMAV
ncbi:MAG: recombinase family protein [Clostridia bacterium]|nr:recombinase family protein [Clostridia bacterium]